MEWNVSELYMLGAASCTNCNGSGIHRVNKGELVPCGCALRAVFRACHQRFRISLGRGHCRTASFERNPRGKTHRNSWSRKEEEYIADFELVSRRHLDAFHYKIFRYHFLLGADWKLYGRRFGMNGAPFITPSIASRSISAESSTSWSRMGSTHRATISPCA